MFCEKVTVGRGVGLSAGVGVREGVTVGVIVLVGVMVGPGGCGVWVQVAVADGMKVGDGDGVNVGVAVWLGVAEGVGSAPEPGVLLSAAGTVGKVVRVGDGLAVAVELAAAGDMAETRVGVGLLLQPARAFKTRTMSSKVVQRATPPLPLARRSLGRTGALACRNERCVIIDWVHFPTQKLPKMLSTRSSLAVWPVISPKALTAAIRSMETRSASRPDCWARQAART
jgi:hypothetical protein